MFLLMCSESYRQLGGMDEKFFLYLEDVDFCTRARLRGMKILVDSNIRIIHEAKRSSRKSLKYLLLHLRSAVFFFTSSVYRQALKKL
jgi:GT2 family glycosyltransferase